MKNKLKDTKQLKNKTKKLNKKKIKKEYEDLMPK